MLSVATGAVYAGLVLLLGGVLARRLWTPSFPRLRWPLAGGALLLLGWGLQVALTLGALGFTAPADVQAYLTGTGTGRAMLTGLMGAALLLAAESGGWPWPGLLLGAAVTLWGAAGVGHGSGHGAWTRAEHALHAGAMSVWLGGVLTLLGRPSWALARRFTPVALTCVVVLAATGFLMARTHLPLAAQWPGTGYGQALLVKLALVALALGAAVLVRRAFVRRADGVRPHLAREGLLLLAALGVTVWLVTQAPPGGHDPSHGQQETGGRSPAG
ncbi:hypothetical protein GO986_06145 [Deinococcus sp. HMF7620]|uniref:Copper resistance protein D domain-containing protein n=1 Tax=Deinococcus arboris TaxID=2682977 RepID=A0A7C9M0U9_9DEIO|nr:CopD family protein [Deinococcus arboris]MVN86342.1 hypothetical protein [Deinococcus arboris]